VNNYHMPKQIKSGVLRKDISQRVFGT